MKINFLCSSLLAVLLTACTFSETKKDTQIDPRIKNQIHVLNNRIVEGLVGNTPEKIFTVCSDKLLEKKGDIKMLMQLLKGNLKKPDFKILHEFYQKNASKKNIGTVSSGVTGQHDYQIRYGALNKEMYVVVGCFLDSTEEKCFTLIYGKQGNEWKLNNIQVGILKISNKDAFDWYQLAKSDYQKGYLIDAICKIGVSTQLLKPANHMWQYNKEAEIQTFERKITKLTYTNYHFPITVDYVETKPVIFRVYAQTIPDGCFPVILYTTSVELTNIPELSKECKEIHRNIGKLFKGIDTNNKIILYRPVKTIPTGTETTKQYGFMMRTK